MAKKYYNTYYSVALSLGNETTSLNEITCNNKPTKKIKHRYYYVAKQLICFLNVGFGN